MRIQGTSQAFVDKHTNGACPRKLGETVTFEPEAFTDERYNSDPHTAHKLTGCVVYINEARRYYTVEAQCYGYTLRESFKF